MLDWSNHLTGCAWNLSSGRHRKNRPISKHTIVCKLKLRPVEGSANILKSVLFWWLNERLKNDQISLVFFSVAYRDLIRHQRTLLKTFYPSASRRLALHSSSWGGKKRIAITDEFPVDMASVVRSPARNDQDNADQLIVDALTSGSKPTLDAFLRRQEIDPRKPYWDREYSENRVGQVSRLLDADENSFVIVVEVQGDGLLRILDGHHRFRIREIRGSQTAKVVVGINGTSIESSSPLSSFLTQVCKRPSRVYGSG